MMYMLSCIQMHTHIYCWKLSPCFVLLDKVCPWFLLARRHLATLAGKYFFPAYSTDIYTICAYSIRFLLARRHLTMMAGKKNFQPTVLGFLFFSVVQKNPEKHGGFLHHPLNFDILCYTFCNRS
jgi:hypothetical protein